MNRKPPRTRRHFFLLVAFPSSSHPSYNLINISLLHISPSSLRCRELLLRSDGKELCDDFEGHSFRLGNLKEDEHK